jgi:hypothetical protein
VAIAGSFHLGAAALVYLKSFQRLLLLELDSAGSVWQYIETDIEMRSIWSNIYSRLRISWGGGAKTSPALCQLEKRISALI